MLIPEFEFTLKDGRKALVRNPKEELKQLIKLENVKNILNIPINPNNRF